MVLILLSLERYLEVVIAGIFLKITDDSANAEQCVEGGSASDECPLRIRPEQGRWQIRGSWYGSACSFIALVSWTMLGLTVGKEYRRYSARVL